MKEPMIDYRKLRMKNLGSDAFKHVKMLLFWPIYGLLFLFVERFYQVDSYHTMYCFIDDWIPFCEWFFIPYMFWFVYLVGMHLYTLLYDVDSFQRLMKYIMITYSAAVVIYFVYPTCQQLRPLVFERKNILTTLISYFYQFDTNTNVCPSIHVMGSLAVMETALRSDRIRSKGIKTAFAVVAILICLSTLFMKQHSVLDVLLALPICMVAHFVCFGKRKKAKKDGDI